MIEQLKNKVLGFVDSCAVEGRPGVYCYSPACSTPTLYSSGYVSRILSLFADTDSISDADRQAWIAYTNEHQDDDGLYRDPVIYGTGWYKDDPLWCGRTHLTGHVLAGLTALGAIAPKPLEFVRPWCDPDYMRSWLESRDWGKRVAFTGNEICNIGRLLQYMRDFHNDDRAATSVELMLDWLLDHRFNPELGLWGQGDPTDMIWISQAIQGAYHWWILYFYEQRPLPEVERTIDTLLRSQNPLGGFGWGVHNNGAPYRSSACEDIDSTHPLAQLSVQTNYRNNEIRAALKKAADWILSNQYDDGGFAFVKGIDNSYGHPELSNPAGTSGLFPTWFRLLNLAQIGKALPDHPLGKHPWHFDRCPGPQIWNQPETEKQI